MASKGKKGRGKTLNITQFAEDYIPEDALDWADDDWMSEEKKAEGKLAEKLEKQRHEYSRTANNKLLQAEGFRTAQSAEAASPKASLAELKPPYVAHFGNLRNGIPEEDFLALFNRDVIVTHRLINQDGKSFAFVEFSSPQAIAIALLQDGQMFRGRKMYVDLATEKQVDRLLNRNSSPTGPAAGANAERVTFSRDGAGQAQPGMGLANLDLSRDAFGGEQQPTMSRLSDMGSRGGFGSRQDLSALGELSRDMLGSAVQQPMSPSAPGHDSAPPTSALSPDVFANWRNEETVAQPEVPASAGLREGKGSDDGSANKAEADAAGNGRGGIGAAREAHEGSMFGAALAEARNSDKAVDAPPAGREGGSRGGRGGRGMGGGRGSGESRPGAAPAAAAAAVFGNWRDEPRAEQKSPTMAESPTEGERPERRGGGGGRGGRGEGRGGRGGGRGEGRGGRGGGAGGGGAAQSEKAGGRSAPVEEKDWSNLRR